MIFPRRILCDKHHTPMNTVHARFANIPFEHVAYKCEEIRCGTHYTEARGYFDLFWRFTT